MSFDQFLKQASPAEPAQAVETTTSTPAAPNPYAGIDDTEVLGKRNRRVMDFPGVFSGEIVEIRDGVAQYTRAGTPFFAGTMLVTESSHPDVAAGTLMDWSTMPSEKWPKYYLSNIKLFLSAVWGCSAEQVTETVVMGTLDEKQPARGRAVKWETYADQKTGKPRTRFYPAG